ncbi:hypothetical protein Tco_0328219 [Tanacetum coccineum]
MRMKQYLTHTDYALWEVIVNDDAPAIASTSAGTEGPLPPKTFYGINDAKILWKAIKARFGGNKESKKMKKPILKQQYKNFAASRSEGLDKTYDRDGSQMAGGHAYHEGEKILKEDMKETEF